MKYSNYSPINRQANVSVSSNAVDIQQVVKMSAQVVAGVGNITGSLQAQVSNDDNVPMSSGKTPVPTNWSNLGSAIALSAAGITLIPQQDMCYRYLRFVFTDTSGGTGSSNLSVQVMQLGV